MKVHTIYSVQNHHQQLLYNAHLNGHNTDSTSLMYTSGTVTKPSTYHAFKIVN